MRQQKLAILTIAILVISCQLVEQLAVASAQKVSPSAESIIDGWTKALGGRKRIEQIQNVYQYGATMEGGLQGCIEEWSTAEGQHRRFYERTGVD